jgi:hypothetical protein
MPQKGTATIALGNSSAVPLHTTVQFTSGDSQEVDIAPFATNYIRRRAQGGNAPNSSEGAAEGVRLTTAGPPGSLRVVGVVTSVSKDYSSSIRFYDPQAAVQPHLFATNLRLKETLPRMVLKNTGDTEVTAQPRFRPAAGEGGGVVELSSLTLGPREVVEVDLSPLVSAAAGRSDLDSVSVQVTNTGSPGSLIGALNGVRTDAAITYDVPLRDSGKTRNLTGSYPWRVDKDYTTIVTITNVGEQPAKFHVDVRYPGGSYYLAPRELAIGETASFDLREMQAAQRPDHKGNKFPTDVSSGQFHWSVAPTPGNPKLIGRAEVVSRSRRVSSSYSCPTCCPDSGPFGGWVPGGAQLYVDGFAARTSSGDYYDCYWHVTSGGTIWMSNAWTEDTAVATIASFTGDDPNLYGAGAGDTYLVGEWGQQYYDTDGMDCYYRYYDASDSAPVPVSPTVTFGTLHAVGKDQTASIQVTLNPSPSSVSVTLTLAATSGTGSAVFTSNNSSTLVISQSGPVEIKGITESSTAGNIQLEAKANEQSLGTVDFTVLLVTLTLRTSGSVSTDNSASSTYASLLGTTSLGAFMSSGTGNHIRRNGVEIVATASPSNYTGSITINREVVATKNYNDMTLTGSAGPFADTSDASLRDDDPLSGGSSGKVYDLDAPGIGSIASTPLNTILRRRTNFRQWATVGGNRVSTDLTWFQRISIIKTSSGDQLNNDLSGDNTVGTGATNLTWNFQ